MPFTHVVEEFSDCVTEVNRLGQRQPPGQEALCAFEPGGIVAAHAPVRGDTAVRRDEIRVQREGAPGPREGVPFRLKTYSMDQPGIVHRITSYLRDHDINVEELVTRLESAPFMGTPVFTMEILMLVPKKVSVKALRGALEELGDALNCDVDIDPA